MGRIIYCPWSSWGQRHFYYVTSLVYLLFRGAPPTSTSIGGLVYLGETLFLISFLTQGILLMLVLLRRVVLFLYLGTTPSTSMLLGVIFSLAILTLGGNLHFPVMLSRISPMSGRTLFFTSRCIFPLLIWGDHMVV